jgi:hypothetical protein
VIICNSVQLADRIAIGLLSCYIRISTPRTPRLIKSISPIRKDATIKSYGHDCRSGLLAVGCQDACSIDPTITFISLSRPVLTLANVYSYRSG